LKDRISEFDNVFTHNPWGEYGHPEHVQVFRAVEKINKKAQFSLWYSTYCSNKSFRLMLESITFNSKIISFKQNKILGEKIKQLYQKYDCWTWYDEWHWPLQESFIQHKGENDREENYGKVVPISLIKKRPPAENKKNIFFISRLFRKIFQKNYFRFH
jgi:LmbE family N-acetylglucosaminyl deacetylase